MYCNKCGDKIEPNEKFCNKCGNPLNITQSTITGITSSINTIPNFNNKSISTTKENNKRNIVIGISTGVSVLIILLLIVNFIDTNSKKYFFNQIPDNQTNEIIQNNDNSQKNSYSTVIIYDNVYNGVTINNDLDALTLISEDSTSQKNNCPNEIKQVEDEIINTYGITAVNLCEMDVNFAQELENVFKKIYEEYPYARGFITNLTLVNGSMSNDYIAAFMPVFTFATSNTTSTYPWVIKTQVLLNTTYFLNKERLNDATSISSNTGHFPKNSTIYSPLAHELGHYLSYLAMMKYYQINSILLIDNDKISTFYDLIADFEKGKYSLTMITEAYEKYKRDTNTILSLDEWRGTISNYAVAKNNNGGYIYDETIAESFHDVYLNGENASDASKYIVNILKEKLES